MIGHLDFMDARLIINLPENGKVASLEQGPVVVQPKHPDTIGGGMPLKFAINKCPQKRPRHTLFSHPHSMSFNVLSHMCVIFFSSLLNVFIQM